MASIVLIIKHSVPNFKQCNTKNEARKPLLVICMTIDRNLPGFLSFPNSHRLPTFAKNNQVNGNQRNSKGTQLNFSFQPPHLGNYSLLPSCSSVIPEKGFNQLLLHYGKLKTKTCVKVI